MAVTAKQATIDAIKRRTWVSGRQIVAQGGDLRRLRELRAEGWDIKRRGNSSTGFEYRLVSRPKVAA